MRAIAFSRKSFITLVGITLVGIIVALAVVVMFPDAGDETFFVVAVYGVAGVGFWWMRNILGDHVRFRFVTLPSFFLLSYLLLIAFPALGVFLDKADPARFTFLIAIHLALLCVLVGVWLAVTVLGSREKDIRAYARARLAWSLRERNIGFPLRLGIGIAVVIMIGYLDYVEDVPLFVLLGADTSKDMEVLRDESLKLLPPAIYLGFEWAREFFLPFLAMVAAGVFFVRRRVPNLYIALAVFGIALLFATLSLAKAPPLITIVMMFLYLLLARGIRLPVWAWALVPVAAFSIPVYIVGSTSVGTDITPEFIWWVVKDLILRRILYLPADVLYQYFDAFPLHHEFLWGHSVRWLAVVFGWNDFLLPNYIYHHMQHGTLESGWANAAFVGAAWADFGWVGVISFSVLVGFLLQALQHYVTANGKTVLNLALHVFLLVFSGYLTMTSLTGVVMMVGIPMAIVTVGIFRWMGTIGESARNRESLGSEPA